MQTFVVLGSIVVSIPACQAGDGGSIPRRGGMCFLTTILLSFRAFLAIRANEYNLFSSVTN